MALTTPPAPESGRPLSSRGVTAPANRLPGPDVVRAIALVGVVVMNYHGYLLLRSGSGSAGIGDGWLAMVFDPWNGPLSTRFAATFVVVAGVGVVLLTRNTLGDPRRVAAARWRLARRGLLLYVVGLVVDEIWPGTILPYYGAMFILAGAMFTWRTRWIVAAGVASTAAAAAIRLWRFEREDAGHNVGWLTNPGDDSVRRYVFDVAINGTHPLLPWLTFFCAGMVLGRALDDARWRRVAVGVGAALVAIPAVVTAARTAAVPPDAADVALSLNPFDRGSAYVASALGTALIAYAAIDWVATRFRGATEPLRRAGQMTLTLYMLHIVVFNLLVDWWGWIEPTGLDVALALAAIFWVVAIAGASSWQRRYGRGPAEYVYRAFGG